jgi:hypothetical protein
MEIVNALNDQFNNSFSYKVNQDGSFTVVQKPNSGPENVYDPRYENDPNILTPQSVSKVLNPYYNMFRQKGWRFDQPVGGQFTIAIPAQQVANEGELEEDDMEEGNEFSGELKKARDAGKKEFEVDGKKYKVREDKDKDGKCEDCGCVKSECECDDKEDKPVNESISVLKKLAGVDVNKKQLNECGMSAPMGISSENREGRMNISTNMSSDGNKNVTITADGDAANDLMQMLKLAGMDGLNQASDAPTLAVAGMPAMHSVPSIAVGHDHGGVDSMSDLMRLIDGGDDSEEEHSHEPEMHDSGEEEVYTAATADDSEEHDDDKEMEEEHVPGHLADNKPRTQQMSVQKQIRGGDGDVAGQQKHMYKSGSARFSDNPMAVSENSFSGRLLKEYESIKIKSNKK